MLDALTDPFSTQIAQRALAELIILGAVCGPLSVWVVLYRQGYAAESIAHAALPGLVIASLAAVPLALGAGIGVLAAALAIAAAARVPAVASDTAIAVVVTALIGLGALLGLSPDVPARLGSLLFGDPLAVSGSDLVVSAAVAIPALAGLAITHRRLAIAAFEPISAASMGASPRRAEAAVLVLLGLTTLVAVEALGNLLVVALLIAPGATALRMCRRLFPALVTAAALAVTEGAAGLYASHYLELAAGACVALVAVGVFALSLLWPGRWWNPRLRRVAAADAT